MRFYTQSFLCAVAMLALGGFLVMSAQGLSEQDQKFLQDAAKGGMMEVAMGQVAEQKAQSEDVKSFGKRMVTDHGKANDELKSIASKKGVQLPSKEHTAKWTSDKAYIDMMVQDHEKDVKKFRQEAEHGGDPELKSFAQNTLPVLEQHLKLAQETNKSLTAVGSSNRAPGSRNR